MVKTLVTEDFDFLGEALEGATDGDLSLGPFLLLPRIKESRRSVEDISLFLAKQVLPQKGIRHYQKIQLTGLKGDIRKRNNPSTLKRKIARNFDPNCQLSQHIVMCQQKKTICCFYAMVI